MSSLSPIYTNKLPCISTDEEMKQLHNHNIITFNNSSATATFQVRMENHLDNRTYNNDHNFNHKNNNINNNNNDSNNIYNDNNENANYINHVTNGNDINTTAYTSANATNDPRSNRQIRSQTPLLFPSSALISTSNGNNIATYTSANSINDPNNNRQIRPLTSLSHSSSTLMSTTTTTTKTTTSKTTATYTVNSPLFSMVSNNDGLYRIISDTSSDDEFCLSRSQSNTPDNQYYDINRLPPPSLKRSNSQGNVSARKQSIPDYISVSESQDSLLSHSKFHTDQHMQLRGTSICKDSLSNDSLKRYHVQDTRTTYTYHGAYSPSVKGSFEINLEIAKEDSFLNESFSSRPGVSRFPSNSSTNASRSNSPDGDYDYEQTQEFKSC
eukprot:Awhi_evm1s10954